MSKPFFIPIGRTLQWPENREILPGPGDIHIWKGGLSGDDEKVTEYYAMLPGAEKTRAERLLVEAVRRRYVSAHGIVRCVLGKYLGKAPAEVAIESAPEGKPFLGGQPAMRKGAIHFNLAHSQDTMLMCMSRDFDTGIDLEFVDPKAEFEQISRHFFSDSDRAWLDSQPAERKPAAFFQLWTCKEAVLKAEGSGMRIGLANVSIEFAEGEDSARGVITSGSEAGRAWSIRCFEPASEYAAALAYEDLASAANSPKLMFFQWMG